MAIADGKGTLQRASLPSLSPLVCCFTSSICSLAPCITTTTTNHVRVAFVFEFVLVLDLASAFSVSLRCFAFLFVCLAFLALIAAWSQAREASLSLCGRPARKLSAGARCCWTKTL
jgi:hypothetical protein